MTGDYLLSRANDFRNYIDAIKTAIDPAFPWYPYHSLQNFTQLQGIFNVRPLNSLVKDRSRLLDLGAADGDVAYFLETLGYEVEIIDFGPTNFNGLRGARILNRALKSTVTINEIDIDAQFPLLKQRYELIFFLGILYHLKNPFFLLEALSKVSKYLLLSTRIAQFAPDGTAISHLPVGYLLDTQECNNDSTNYWIFSASGLHRLFRRSGWNVLEYSSVGDVKTSNPRDADHDERVFVLLESIAR